MGSEVMGDEDLAEAFEGVMVALEAPDTFLNGEPRPRGLFHGAEAGQHGKILVARVVHDSKVRRKW